MKELRKESVTWAEIGPEAEDQRIDNFLLRTLKGVPKSHVYRILRSGEVRVNSGRVDPTYRLQAGDRVRIPPVRTARSPDRPLRLPDTLGRLVLFEDESLIAIDKPSGMAVHGGSGISLGLIERLRAERPEARFLELVHRLDRETSGVLLVARKRSALTELHRQIREGETDKRYLALALGNWWWEKRAVRAALHRYTTSAGERRVAVDDEGQASETVFRLRRKWPGFALLEAELRTGRTHQIRVHLQHVGCPIAGDDKYGNFESNRDLARRGLKRMFLHAWRMEIRHPATGEPLVIESPLPTDLSAFVEGLDAEAV